MVSKGMTLWVAMTCSISSRMTTCATPETSRSASMALRVSVGALSFANVWPSASTESRLIEASVNGSRSHRVTTDGRNSGIFTPPGVAASRPAEGSLPTPHQRRREHPAWRP